MRDEVTENDVDRYEVTVMEDILQAVIHDIGFQYDDVGIVLVNISCGGGRTKFYTQF